MYTNIQNFGGKFINVIDKEFASSSDIIIASGYTSFDILNRYKSHFIRVVDEGGSAKLLLGMAFYEGLSANKLKLLHQLSTDLENKNKDSGVYVTYSGKYHGKIYKFFHGKESEIYLGSSNFSRSGLSENIEATTLIRDTNIKNEIDDFLDFLFSDKNAVSIKKADITVPGTAKYSENLSLKTLDDLQRYSPSTVDKSKYPFFEFSLSRIAEMEKSNLNVYFGKGRWNRKTGEVKPRHWYEVELIANAEIIQNPYYPKGDFLAYTDDGFIIPMKSSGDYFKNIRSRGSLDILGQWIKGKLQKSGALIPLTPVTQDILDIYGNDTIRFYKLDNDRYYVEF